MIPKDKANQLYSKYFELGKDHTRGVSMKHFAKECALIAVQEHINSLVSYEMDLTVQIHYWRKVKAEIEKI